MTSEDEGLFAVMTLEDLFTTEELALIDRGEYRPGRAVLDAKLDLFTARFADLVVKAEREACAEVCMRVSGKYVGVGAGASPWSFGASEAASKCAKYIRARHKK